MDEPEIIQTAGGVDFHIIAPYALDENWQAWVSTRDDDYTGGFCVADGPTRHEAIAKACKLLKLAADEAMRVSHIYA